MASKSVVAFWMINLAIFGFVSTSAATCPDLNVCLDIADSLLTAQFGSQSRTQCCSLINGLVDADAALCLCTSLKTTLGGPLGSALGLLNSLLGALTNDILKKEFLLILNACGFNDASKYSCAY